MGEMQFLLDPEKIARLDRVVVQLGEKTPDGSFLAESISRSWKEWDTLAQGEAEKKALQRLFGGQTSVRLREAFLPPAEVVPFFRELAHSRSLYCVGKELVVDLFNTLSFFYAATLLPSGELELEGMLKGAGKTFGLRDCLCLGPGSTPWVVHGCRLQFIDTEISWKNMKELYRNLKKRLNVGEKRQFLQELQDNEQVHCLHFVCGSWEEAETLPEPLPRLVLRERTGGFADLWMDYGIEGLVAFHDLSPCLVQSGGKRNLRAEGSWEKDLLETDYRKKADEQSHYYCPLDRVGKSLGFLLELGWNIVVSMGSRLVKWSGIESQVQEEEGRLLVRGGIRFQDFEADLTRVKGAFNRKERFLCIGEGVVGLLPERSDAGCAELYDFLEEGEEALSGLAISTQKWGLLKPLLEERPDWFTWSLGKEGGLWSGSALLGEEFHGTLRPYQQTGLEWIYRLYRNGLHGILADDMGLGKTVQAAAFFSLLPKNSCILLIAPTSLLFNWRQELERFCPSLPLYIHHGSKRGKKEEELPSQGILLTTYATLRVDLGLWSKRVFDAIVLDEAQVIKNAESETAKAVFQLQGQFRLSLTGTPLENRLSELWSQFHFLMPGLLGREEEFRSWIEAASVDGRYLKKVQKKVAPFLLRRTKKEVLPDLPSRIDQTVWVEMLPEQREAYDTILSGFKSRLLHKVAVDGVSRHRMEILEALLRLRQICCHPRLVPSFASGTSAKFDACLADIETLVLENKKILLYSQFTSMLDLFAVAAKERGISFLRLDGQTKNREEVVQQFQQEGVYPLFLVSLKAGGVGLNLTAADYVLLFDPWWNEAAEEQAIARAHRMGRKEVCVTKRYVTLESIEEKMVRLKSMKRDVVDQILQEGEGVVSPTLEELYELFQ